MHVLILGNQFGWSHLCKCRERYLIRTARHTQISTNCTKQREPPCNNARKKRKKNMHLCCIHFYKPVWILPRHAPHPHLLEISVPITVQKRDMFLTKAFCPHNTNIGSLARGVGGCQKYHKKCSGHEPSQFIYFVIYN